VHRPRRFGSTEPSHLRLSVRLSGLRVRLLLLLLLFGAVPTLVLTFVAVKEWRRHELRGSQEEARELVRRVVASRQRSIEAAEGFVVRLTARRELQRVNAGVCAKLLSAEWSPSSRLDAAGILGADGHLLCAQGLVDDVSMETCPYIRRAIETRALAVAGEVDPGMETGTIGFAQPVMDATGRIVATVFATVDLANLGPLVASADEASGTSLFLTDDTGRILFHFPDSGRWVGTSIKDHALFKSAVGRHGATETIGLDGVRRLFAFQPMLGDEQVGNVYVVGGINPRMAFADIDRTLTLSVVGLGVAGAIALVSAWLGSDLLVLRSVRALAGAARRVTLGDLGARTGVRAGAAEVVHLAETFDDMAAALEARQREADAAKQALNAAQQDLEARIEERTNDLTRANEALHAALVRREQAEEALRKLSSAVEQTADSVFICSHDGVIEYVNPAFEALTGYGATEAIGKTPSILKSGLHDERLYRVMWDTIVSGEPYRGVLINRKQDGSLYFEEKTVTPLRSGAGNISHFVSVGRDISDQKRVETELRRSREALRALTGRLESVREDERSRIAREIHDELGQVLTGLKFDLSHVASRTTDDGQVEYVELVRSMITTVDDAIDSVRRIATELRPGVLDDLGLEAAIEWQAREFETRTGIRCRFCSSLDETEVRGDLATVVFRILQETLTNVARHSGATKVEVTLETDAESRDLVLTVSDDGRGITTDELEDRRSLGLLGMRERALMLQGKLSIVGDPGRGTTVSLAVPIDAPGGPGSAGAPPSVMEGLP
jgi:PAS domain S-box-containing protein